MSCIINWKSINYYLEILKYISENCVIFKHLRMISQHFFIRNWSEKILLLKWERHWFLFVKFYQTPLKYWMGSLGLELVQTNNVFGEKLFYLRDAIRLYTLRRNRKMSLNSSSLTFLVVTCKPVDRPRGPLCLSHTVFFFHLQGSVNDNLTTQLIYETFIAW